MLRRVLIISAAALYIVVVGCVLLPAGEKTRSSTHSASTVGYIGAHEPLKGLPLCSVTMQLQRTDWIDKYEEQIDQIAALGADTVQFVVDPRQENGKSERIYLDMRMTPTPEQLGRLIKHAKEKGLRVTLMPIVLLDNPIGDEWRGKIHPDSWDEWFDSYRNIMEHFAYRLPAWLHDPFAAAMSQSMLLPAFIALFGIVAAVFLLGFGDPDSLVEDDDDELDDPDRNAGFAVEYGGDETFVDDDEYLEYEVHWDDDPADPEPVTQAEPVVRPEPVVHVDDPVTEPMQSRADHLLHAPAEAWHSAPVESWRHLPPDDEPVAPAHEAEPDRESWRNILDQLLTDVPPVKPKSEPIGFAHNGFHVDEEERFQPLPPPAREPTPPPAPESTPPPRHERRARHYLPENQPQKRPFWFESGRHSRDDDPDDASRYGRHSTPP